MTNDQEHQTLLDFAEDINAWLSDLVDGQAFDLADAKSYRDQARAIIDELENA